MDQERPAYLPEDAPMTAEEEAAAYRKILEKIKASDDEYRLRADNARLRAELEQEREEMVSLADEIQRAVGEAIGAEHYNESPVELVLELRNALDDAVSRLSAAEAKLARVDESLTKWSCWARDSDKLAMTGKDARDLLESIRAPGVSTHEPAPGETQSAKCESCETQAKLEDVLREARSGLVAFAGGAVSETVRRIDAALAAIEGGESA